MKTWGILLFLMLLPVTGLAMDQHPPGHGSGEKIPKYAVDSPSGAQKNTGMKPIHDNEIFAIFRGDRLEYQTREGKDALLWDVQAWAGSDYNKLYLKSEGTWLTGENEFDEAEVELLYSRNIATFWDLQAGIRHDFEPEPSRTFAALGVEGLAPYWFEVDTTVYISEDGDVSANLETEYDLILTQRLILQPRFETNIAVQEVEELNIGQGINDIQLGVRLRYEIRREFAPYIGVSWSRKIGETADLAEEDGEDIDVISFVAGIKLWF